MARAQCTRERLAGLRVARPERAVNTGVHRCPAGHGEPWKDFEQKKSMHRWEFQVNGRRWKVVYAGESDAGTWERSS